MHDLTTETTEEKEAMDMLEAKNAVSSFVINNHVGNTPTQQEQHELNHAIIQGATGAQYTPMDTSPNAQPNIHQLAQQLSQSFNTLINAILELQAQDKQPVSEGKGLHEAVDTVLEQAGWFDDKVKEVCELLIGDNDFSYEIESAVETHFSNSFSLDDHIDVASEIESIVDDRLNDMVQEKVEEILREKLSTATISFN
jgi:CRISPR/Cas system-associated exonuclease Cas4 (RecB family)